MPRVGAIEYAEPKWGQVWIRTTPCVMCGKQHELVVSQAGYESWQYGNHIQDALPELSPDDRELLISGTCDNCFNNLFEEKE